MTGFTYSELHFDEGQTVNIKCLPNRAEGRCRNEEKSFLSSKEFVYMAET
jgi:hypothetical protein